MGDSDKMGAAVAPYKRQYRFFRIGTGGYVGSSMRMQQVPVGLVYVCEWHTDIDKPAGCWRLHKGWPLLSMSKQLHRQRSAVQIWAICSDNALRSTAVTVGAQAVKHTAAVDIKRVPVQQVYFFWASGF